MTAKGELRTRLREATREAHERLHVHPGFGAASRGDVSRSAYIDLLARLYGFHKAFEAGYAAAPAAMAEAIELDGRRRSQDLRSDLEALGFGGELDGLETCAAVPARASEAEWLGALYVTEGSTLGGALIARTLESAGFSAHERRFFLAYGERRSWMWRIFVARLETHADDEPAARAAEASAVRTFAAFDAWVADWQGAAGR